MGALWIPIAIHAVAALIWCGRGLWRWYPAWTWYCLAGLIQSFAMVYSDGDSERAAGIWAVASPLLLAGQVDSVLEIFLRLSGLYRRFRRDRWKWLLFPLGTGLIAGLALVFPLLDRPSDYYRALFLANIAVGTVCAAVLVFCWIASIPVRLPINLRKHLVLLAIYVGSSTLAFAGYFNKQNQQTIRSLLLFMPPMVMLTWALFLDPLEERASAKPETEMPESTLEQLLGLLKRVS